MAKARYNYGLKTVGMRGLQPLMRAVMVVSSVAVLATGVTYAALQSKSASLTSNSISTATADLRIATGDGTTFSTSRTGFSFASVVPGAAAAPADGNSFYLKNYGTVQMALKVAISTVPANVSNVDLSKTFFVITRVDTSSVQKLSVATLVSANATGGTALTDNLAGGATAQYKTQVVMDDDAFSGQSASISGMDLVFNGTVVAQ
jgi:hypothetical protein